jgi:hypothetical protein
MVNRSALIVRRNNARDFPRPREKTGGPDKGVGAMHQPLAQIFDVPAVGRKPAQFAGFTNSPTIPAEPFTWLGWPCTGASLGSTSSRVRPGAISFVS